MSASWEHLAVPSGQVKVRVGTRELLPTPETPELQIHKKCNRQLQSRHSVSFRTKCICKLDLCFKVDQVCSNLSLVDSTRAALYDSQLRIILLCLILGKKFPPLSQRSKCPPLIMQMGGASGTTTLEISPLWDVIHLYEKL